MSNKKDNTPFLPGFQAFFKGRPNISKNELTKRALVKIQQSSIQEFRQLFSGYIPCQLFSLNYGKHFTRSRIYNLEVIFWAFLSQILLKNTSCSEIVKKVQTWRIDRKLPTQSSGTGAYCKAKKKLSLSFLKTVFKNTVKVLSVKEKHSDLWCGRVVKVVDGTGLSMPDTKENQKVYPQNGSIKPGCGFPQLNMVAVFSLATGSLLGYAKGNKHSSESRLWQKLFGLLKKEDIVLGDRGYLSFMNIAYLSSKKIDSVIRWKDRIKRIKKYKKLGENDYIYLWKKPVSRSLLWSKEIFFNMPDEIYIRIVEISVNKNGFRTRKMKIVTTLLDHERYSAEDIGKLYFKRWIVELRLKDIKTTMGMDILKAKTPRQVEKEIAMFTIAYNLIRGIMLDAARHCSKEIDRISFSDTLNQLKQWMTLFAKTTSGFRTLLFDFYQCICQKTITKRPGRNEPRVKKRRAKNFHLMTKPRREMIIDCHRNRPDKKNAFYTLK
jgi:hypothetical protein